MQIRVTNIKLDDRSFTEPAKINMFVPAAEHYNQMIYWLKEFCCEPFTVGHALETYIRTAIFYGSTKITYDHDILVSSRKLKAINSHQPFVADIHDQEYTTYNKQTIILQLPSQVIFDESSLPYSEYEDNIDQLIFEALLVNLPFHMVL